MKSQYTTIEDGGRGLDRERYVSKFLSGRREQRSVGKGIVENVLEQKQIGGGA